MNILINLPMEVQIFIVVMASVCLSAIVCWFGEVLTPDDLV